MAMLFLALSVIGYIVMLVGWIWILVVAFKHSLGWGLASLLIPLVGLIFVALNFAAAKKPFLIWLAGLGLAIIGGVLAVVLGTPTATMS
jgi:hypothetical protein